MFTEQADTENVLNPSTKRDFWLSWLGKRITAGKGVHVGEEVITEKEGSDEWIQVNALSWSAMLGVTADFEFPREETGKRKFSV